MCKNKVFSTTSSCLILDCFAEARKDRVDCRTSFAMTGEVVESCPETLPIRNNTCRRAVLNKKKKIRSLT